MLSDLSDYPPLFDVVLYLINEVENLESHLFQEWVASNSVRHRFANYDFIFKIDSIHN